MIFNKNRIKTLPMMKMHKKPYLNFWALFKKLGPEIFIKESLTINNALIAATLMALTRGLMNLP